MASLLAIQLIGVALSVFLIAVTFASPRQVEERVQGFAIAKVEAAANDTWTKADNALGEGGRAERLGDLAERFGLDIRKTEETRQELVAALVARAVMTRCGDNPCNRLGALAATAAVDGTMLNRIATLRIGRTTLQDFIAERYSDTVGGLIADLRQFGAVNLVALLLSAALVIHRKRLNWRLVAFSVGVTSYTAWATYHYVFTQDWARTILFRDWAGPGYQIAMVVVCLLLIDWLFLDAWVTRTVTNAIASGLSSFGI